jgi:rare lipoprotein A
MMHSAVRRAVMPLLLLATLGLAGCSGTLEDDGPVLASNATAPVQLASSDGEDVGAYMIGKPYKAGGRWFTPKDEPDYDETGKASWYG